MKPETRTVTEFFERDVRYVVPLYQRPYVWNGGDQWEPQWEDIRVLVDHQLNGAAGRRASVCRVLWDASTVTLQSAAQAA